MASEKISVEDLRAAWRRVERASSALAFSLSRPKLPGVGRVKALLGQGAMSHRLSEVCWMAMFQQQRNDLLEAILPKASMGISERRYLLDLASRAGSVRGAELVLDDEAFCKSLATGQGTPIKNAVLQDNIDMARLLVSKGAAVDWVEKSGRWDQGVLGMVKSVEMFELLHAAGAPLSYMAMLRSALMEDDGPNVPLLQAMESKNPSILKEHDGLHAWGALFKDTRNAMIHPEKRLEMAKYLLSRGEGTLVQTTQCPLAAWHIMLQAGVAPAEVFQRAVRYAENDNPWIQRGQFSSGAAVERERELVTTMLRECADRGLDLAGLWARKPQPEFAGCFVRAGVDIVSRPGWVVSDDDIAEGQAYRLSRQTASAPQVPRMRL